MEYYNGIIGVTYDELISSDDPVVKEGTLRSWLSRGNVQYARRAFGEGVYALIAYDSLPPKTKQKFEAKYGNPADVLRQSFIDSKAIMDSQARAFYEAYTYFKNDIETHLSDKLIEEYTLNASVLNTLISRKKEMSALRKALNNSLRDLWNAVLDCSETMREDYNHTLPKNLSRLKEKVKSYSKEGYVSLISGKLGNKNTLVIIPEMGKQLIALKRSVVPVYNNDQIFKEINRIADIKGWKRLKSKQSMLAYLYSPRVQPLWYDAVHGELKTHQKYSRKHKTSLPTMRDSLWYGDGTKLNIYYLDDQGVVRTTSVYEVIDAFSEVLLGYYISDHEDFNAQYHAYRMAIQVAGHIPYELVHDNQGGHKKLDSSNFFDKICQVHRTTAPYSGQSKTIENVFGRFQQQVLHKDWRFTGQNITARGREARANLERIEANKDRLFTLSELKAYYQEARKEWNSMPHPATGLPRIEMYEQSVNPETQPIGVYELIDIFWIMNDRKNTFTSSGLEITINKQKYTYDVYTAPGIPNHDWRIKNIGERFRVQYDPYNLTSIRLYKEDKAGDLRFECIAEPYMTIHRNIQEQTKEEALFIKQEQAAVLENRIELQARARVIEERHGQHPWLTGVKRAKLKGTGAKNEVVEREIDKRVRKYKKDPEELQSGKYTKIVSNITQDELDGEIQLNMKRVASKY